MDPTRDEEWFDVYLMVITVSDNSSDLGLPSGVSTAADAQVFDNVQFMCLDLPRFIDVEDMETGQKFLDIYGDMGRLCVDCSYPITGPSMYWTDLKTAYEQGDWGRVNAGPHNPIYKDPVVFTTLKQNFPNQETSITNPCINLASVIVHEPMKLAADDNHNYCWEFYKNIPRATYVDCNMCLQLKYFGETQEPVLCLHTTGQNNYAYEDLESHDPISTSPLVGDLETAFGNLVPEIIKFNPGVNPDGEEYDDLYHLKFITEGQGALHHSFVNYKNNKVDVDSLVVYHTYLHQNMVEAVGTLQTELTQAQQDIVNLQNTVQGLSDLVYQTYGGFSPDVSDGTDTVINVRLAEMSIPDPTLATPGEIMTAIETAEFTMSGITHTGAEWWSYLHRVTLMLGYMENISFVW